MYTRCPSCSSTFRVTAVLLQMADGDVRCGSCGAVFNALHTLVDDWGAQATPAAPPATTPPAQEDEEPPEESLEFDAPERDWQRFFIATEGPVLRPASRPEPELGPDFDAADEPPDAGDEDSAPGTGADGPQQEAPRRSIEEETADTDTWKAFLQEADTEPEVEPEPDMPEASAPPWVISEDDGRGEPQEILVRREIETAGNAPPIFELAPEPAYAPGEAMEDAQEPAADDPAAIWAESAVGSAAAPGEAPETILDWGPPPSFSKAPPRAPAHTLRWLAACMVAAIVLAGQAAHHFRDRLAADPRYGDLVRTAYARLGQPVYPEWPLTAYEIRGVKAIVENSGPGALDIVAEIAVTGPQPVGLPLVRVVLRDRWTTPVASGVFQPGDYLAEATSATRVFVPGALIPVEISLQDPGSSAQGYEVDVCLPNRRLGLQCKAAADPYRR